MGNTDERLRHWIDSAMSAQAEIARLTAERDQALARAAAAAMDMRKRAAVTYAMYSGVDLTKRLNSLPIDPDAQKALDKILEKAREDAIREAAVAMKPMLRSMISRGQAAQTVLALLTDGDQP